MDEKTLDHLTLSEIARNAITQGMETLSLDLSNQDDIKFSHIITGVVMSVVRFCNESNK
jgi:hypothetical protein